MNIRGLLIGSAAALFTVSGAQAADAIVAAEPEPMEYVRVCDAFGKGYFYIPGTETCLKIGGYLRYDIRGGEVLGLNANRANGGNGDEWDTRSRFSFRVSTASDTEYGALKTYSEVRFNWRQGNNTTELKHGYIDLAGFRVGKTDSAFILFTGKAGNVLMDDLTKWGSEDTNVVQYNYKSDNGMSAVISLEDFAHPDNDYVPNIVAGLGYEGESFRARLVGGYDSSLEEGAIKARLDGEFGGVFAFVMAGWNTKGNFRNDYAQWDGDWAVWGGLSAPITEKLTFNTQLSYDDGETFYAVANVDFKVTDGFSITPELVYRDRDVDGGAWGGIVRFERSF